MKILAISDLHGKIENLPPLKKAIEKEKPDVLVFTGDIVKGHKRGDEWLLARKENRTPRKELPEILQEEKEDLFFYQQFLDFLSSLSLPAFLIPGNMDAPEKRYYQYFWEKVLKNPYVKVIHGQIAYFQDFIFSGWGGEITESEREDFFVLNYPFSLVESRLNFLKM